MKKWYDGDYSTAVQVAQALVACEVNHAIKYKRPNKEETKALVRRVLSQGGN